MKTEEEGGAVERNVERNVERKVVQVSSPATANKRNFTSKLGGGKRKIIRREREHNGEPIVYSR